MDAQTLIVLLIVAWAAFVVCRRFFGRKSSCCGCGSESCGGKKADASALRPLQAGNEAKQSCGCGCDGRGQ